MGRVTQIAQLEFVPPEGKTVYAFNMFVKSGDFHHLRLQAWTNKLTFVGDAYNEEDGTPKEFALSCDFLVIYTDGSSEYVRDVQIIGKVPDPTEPPIIVENNVGKVIEDPEGERNDETTPRFNVQDGIIETKLPDGSVFGDVLADLYFDASDGREVEQLHLFVLGGDYKVLTIDQADNTLRVFADEIDFEAYEQAPTFTINCAYIAYFNDGSFEYVSDLTISAELEDADEQPVGIEIVVEDTEGDDKPIEPEKTSAETPVSRITFDGSTILSIPIKENTPQYTEIAELYFEPPDGKGVADIRLLPVAGDYSVLRLEPRSTTDSEDGVRVNKIYYVGKPQNHEDKSTRYAEVPEITFHLAVEYSDGTRDFIPNIRAQGHLEEKVVTTLDLNSEAPLTLHIPEGTPYWTKIGQFDFVPTDGREVDFLLVWIAGGTFEDLFLHQYYGELYFIGPEAGYEKPINPEFLTFNIGFHVQFTDGTYLYEDNFVLDIVTEFDEPVIVEPPQKTENPIMGTADSDRLTGTAENDLIKARGGDDVLIGLGGNDVLHGNRGADKLDGGAGDDVLKGGKGRDTLFGDVGDDTLYGGRGHDTLLGGAGQDVLRGGGGRDLFIVDAAPDKSLDTIVDFTRGKDSITIRQHEGHVFWQRVGDDVRLSMSTTDKAFLVLQNQDAVFGGDFIDSQINLVEVIGDAIIDTHFGSEGHDELRGDAGIDVLYGGAGDDVLMGLWGNDVLYGGTGDDTLRGDWGDDILYGGAGNDKLHGDEGDDILDGGIGDDRLSGFSGNDKLNGGIGNDVLFGGYGSDVMTGGHGNDIFMVNISTGKSLDTIADFTRGEDSILLFHLLRYFEGEVFWQRVGDDVHLSTAADDPTFLVLQDQNVVFSGDFVDSQINLVEIV